MIRIVAFIVILIASMMMSRNPSARANLDPVRFPAGSDPGVAAQERPTAVRIVFQDGWGQPVAGASIRHEGTRETVTSDQFGRAIIDVQPGQNELTMAEWCFPDAQVCTPVRSLTLNVGPDLERSLPSAILVETLGAGAGIWNAFLAEIPQAPACTSELDQPARLEVPADQRSTPRNAMEAALQAKSWWTSNAPAETNLQNGSVTLIWATACVDGMGRPYPYWGFFFNGEEFAGTVSPQPLASREGGVRNQIALSPGGEDIMVSYLRYTPFDARCCASGGEVWVRYHLEQERGRMVVVLRGIEEPYPAGWSVCVEGLACGKIW